MQQIPYGSQSLKHSLPGLERKSLLTPCLEELELQELYMGSRGDV